MTAVSSRASPPPEIRSTADHHIVDFLVEAGLVDAGGPPVMTALTGGVASDIWRVDVADRRFVVKRALARLRVAQEWNAPVSRNASEVAWLIEAGKVAPEAVPAVLAHDAARGAFAMTYLDPADHPVWKSELREGRADPDFAAAVGRTIGAIHAATAGSAAVAARFADDAVFHAIRLEPYIEATARRHPDIAGALMAVSRSALATRRALVHGDVSPKNILVGPRGPVILDAECAWYGEPAFDLAFCLNHMLLKCLWTPGSAEGFLACFDALRAAYRAQVDWEDPAGLEARACRLLPALLLGRVDGKSPAEYVTREADKDRVRRVARGLVVDPRTSLADIRRAWATEIAS